MDAGFEISDLGSAVSNYTGAKIASVASGAVDKGQDMANAAVNGLVGQLNQEMQDLIGNGIDKIYESLGINEENLQLAKTVINAVAGGVAKIAAIISVIPVDLSFTPSVKDSLSAACMSLKEVAWAIYKDMMFQYTLMVTLVMKQLANPTELLAAVILAGIEIVEKKIDDLCYKYTGYHIIEIYNMCVTGIQLISMLKKISKPSVNGGYEANVSLNKPVMTKQEIFKRLMAYVDTLTPPLRNAFMMLQLKETAMDIKNMIQRFSTMGTDLMSMELKSITDVLELLNSMMGDHPHIVSLSDIVENAINNSIAAAGQVMEAVNNAKSNVGMLTDGLSKEALIAGAVSAVDFSAKQTWKIELDQNKTDNDKSGATHYNLDIYKDPNKLINPLTKALRKIQINSMPVLSAAEISKFMDTLKIMYAEGQKSMDITLYGTIEGLRRVYIFHTALTAEPKEEEKKPETLPPDKLQPSDNTTVYNSIMEYISNNLEEIEKEELRDDQPIVFDIVEILIKILMPFIEILQIIAHYFENYRINKAKCIAHARNNLHISLLDIFEKTGLSKLFDDKDKPSGDDNTQGPSDGNESIPGGGDPSTGTSGDYNFYTVRSYKLNHWISQHFGITPMANRTSLIEARHTARMVLECSMIANMSSLNTKLPTVLYFDSDAIQEDTRVLATGDTRNGPHYKDGTMNGLDQVQKDIYTGDIYITDGKSTETSEIYRCIKRKYNPTK